ncbi:MAG: hypothetical protein ACYC6O_06100 [Thermoleophilia bacterium]
MTNNEIRIPSKEQILKTMENSTRIVNEWPAWKKAYIVEPESNHESIEEPG